VTRLGACALLSWLCACRPVEQTAPAERTAPATAFSAKAERPGMTAVERERAHEAARYSRPDPSAFQLPDACEYRSSSDAKPKASSDRVRIASWNVRWFPDSVFAPGADNAGTDTAWLSCAMTELDAPIIAVQEFRRHELAKDKSKQLVALLNRRTGGDWKLELDRCPDTPGGNESHVGFLYDARRVSGSDFANVDELNPEGGCRGGIHPGLAGYFRFPGGLDLTLVSVHLMWGETSTALELRRRSRDALRSLEAVRLLKSRDDDLAILGDFNTNGCSECGAPLDPLGEVREAASDAARAWPRLSLLDNDLACTEYDGGKPLPLDHVLVTAATKELPKDARVNVSGICPELGCRTFERDSSVFHARLSDHCPIVLELIDRDWD
jgi:endonuclease/exonuclease/phosphatase family metal-dependent hydrolase